MWDKRIKCACGGLCEGICKDQYLYYKRKFGDTCPAAIFGSEVKKHHKSKDAKVELVNKGRRKRKNRKFANQLLNYE